MRKLALVAIALIVIASTGVCPTVSSYEGYLAEGKYLVGQETISTPTYGIYAGIEVSDPDVDHTITTDPCTTFFAWVGV